MATAYDLHGNATPATTDVIYDPVNDASVPKAAWITPLDGAILQAGKASWPLALRLQATDDVQVTAVHFESVAFVAPIAALPYSATNIYQASALVDTDTHGAPIVITATVSDGDPSHDAVYPITIEPVAADFELIDDFSIDATSASTYANKTILMRGAGKRLYIKTPLSLRNLMIAEGAILGNPDQTKLEIAVADRLYIDGDSSIDVTGKGYLGGWAFRDDRTAQNGNANGMTAGGDTTHGASASATAAASASYRGLGGVGWRCDAVYGPVTQPADFGSGGAGSHICCETGGNGGGAVVLRGGSGAGDRSRFVIAGAIHADGAAGSSSTGAGSGGSVSLSSRALIASNFTRITANGGDDVGNADVPRGGGGGRIAIDATDRTDPTDPSDLMLQARGGRSLASEGPNYLDGGAGTVYLRKPGQALGELVVSSRDERYLASTHLTRPTPLGAIALDALTIGPRALARFDEAWVVADPSKVPATTVPMVQSMLTSRRSAPERARMWASPPPNPVRPRIACCGARRRRCEVVETQRTEYGPTPPCYSSPLHP